MLVKEANQKANAINLHVKKETERGRGREGETETVHRTGDWPDRYMDRETDRQTDSRSQAALEL